MASGQIVPIYYIAAEQLTLLPIPMVKISKCQFRCLLLFTIGILSSCNQSELSTQKVANISLIGATIEIFQDPFQKTKNNVSVELFDKKHNRIANDSMIVFINNAEVKVTHKQGLYYYDESYYALADVPVKDTYTVEIVLSNGKKYLLGAIKALPQENEESIIADEKGDFNKNSLVKWVNLKEIDELSIFTSVLLKSRGDNVTRYDAKDVIVKKIPSTGSYVYPKKNYTDTGSTISHLEFVFKTTKTQKTNPDLLEGSTIKVSTSITKFILFGK